MNTKKTLFTVMAAIVVFAANVIVAEDVKMLTESEKETLYVLTGHKDDTGVESRSGVKTVPLTDEVCRKYAIRESVLMYDTDYDLNWVGSGELLRDFFALRGMPVKTVSESTAWLKTKIENGADGTSLIMGNGLVPANWLTKPFAESLLIKYVKNGGRIVWAGDALFVNGQGELGGPFGVGGAFEDSAFRLGGCLGMRVDRGTMYGKNLPPDLKRTEKAKTWGLECPWGLVRPVRNDGILDPFVISSDGEFADGGQVFTKAENPLSGIVLLTGFISGKNLAMMRDIWRCAWWSGSEVKIPEPSATAVAAANPPAIIFPGHDIRSVFLRGEQLTVAVKLNGAKAGKAQLQLLDESGAELRTWSGTIANDGDFAILDLRGLKRGVYRAVLDVEGVKSIREIRVTLPVDKKSLSISMWANFAKPVKRMHRQFQDDILDYGLEPMPTGEDEKNIAAVYDWALWNGVPFVSRRMPDTTQAWTPEGYDNFIRRCDGSIRPVPAEGNRPVAKGYDSPFRRQQQADIFREMGQFDAEFPAYRGVTFTADDYSQWFGPSWNRFAVEGFRNRYGIELPEGAKTSAEGGILGNPGDGVIADDNLSVLAARWFAETHADAARRSSEALKEATGGRGLAAPIPGGMMLPMNMWSSMNPSVGFGQNGWSQASFYYYNAFWQPFMANTFWTAVARMGDRQRTVWVMPDCYISRYESYYEQNLWHLLAGGAQGLGYFMLGQRREASKKALKTGGDVARHYGVYLNSLKPTLAKAVQVIPFENMISVPERWHESVVPWSNLTLAGIDVDPVAADDSFEGAEAMFLMNIRTITESTQANISRFMKHGGKVYIDADSAKVIPHDGMTVVPREIAINNNEGFDADKVRSAIAAVGGKEIRPIESATRGIFTRRFTDSLGNRACWVVDTVAGEMWKKFYSSTRKNQPGDPELEARGGYGQSFNAEVMVNEPVGLIAWDVFAKKAVDFSDGKLTLSMNRWGAKLIVFMPESPAPFEIDTPKTVRPGVRFELAVETSGKCAVPFTVTATDPAGKESAEYRGRLLSNASGRVMQPLEFALNDLRGLWTFKITNEFTDETKSVTVSLK